MIVVEPSSARFEVSEQSVPTDEHLLERISAVENRLSRLTERLERSLDLLLRQVQNSYFDRSLVKTLISLLSEDGLVEASRLERLWSDRCEQDASEHQENSHRNELRQKILAEYPETNRRVFEELVNEGFQLLDDHQVSSGIDKLQRAADMTESSSALNLFIGEHFFRFGKTRIARTYLSKAHDAAPDDVRVLLLLGLTCADNGDYETAKELLVDAIERGGSCFSGHYGLGWLHLTENKWRKALTEFKRALEAHPSPEAHYVLASLYYKLDRDEPASRHLRKAVKMDENYAEAFQLLALIYKRRGHSDLAKEAMARALTRSTRGTKSRKLQNRKSRVGEPLFNARRFHLNGLMTGLDRRLESALKEDALRAFLSIQPNRS